MLFLCPNTHLQPVPHTGRTRISPSRQRRAFSTMGRALRTHPKARPLPFVETQDACRRRSPRRYQTATHFIAIVRKSATIHATCAAFGRNAHKHLQCFASRPQFLVASDQIAGELLVCLRIGLLSALYWFCLPGLFWFSEPSHRTRHLPTSKIPSGPRKLSPTADNITCAVHF